MFRFLFSILLISNAMTFAQNESTYSSSNAAAEMNEFISSFNAAWNTQNSQALSSLWREDGDLMTPWGRWIIGRGQIERYFEQEKKGPFGKSTIEQSIDNTRLLTAQLALLDASIKLNNINDLGTSNLLQHGTYLLTQVDHKWKIVSARIFHFQPSHKD